MIISEANPLPLVRQDIANVPPGSVISVALAHFGGRARTSADLQEGASLSN